ncbi:hypothetical protein [Stigmatella hybrida]|uniref:hypothetical protein n=1 Tax=Stigmatella hybrida TaxID=394097 RepID=UPI001CDABD7E|nr:hypothetical protein [Stigmatella hybrida]
MKTRTPWIASILLAWGTPVVAPASPGVVTADVQTFFASTHKVNTFECPASLNGTSAARISGLRFVRNADVVDKAYFSSFFGGATAEFAPVHNSYVWYDDLKVSTSPLDICELSGGC